MSFRIQVVSIIVAVLLLALVFELVRRKKIAEEYSVFWLVTCFSILLIAVWKELLFRIAKFLGVADATSLLLLALAALFIVYSLHLSVRVTKLSQESREVVQWLGVLRAKVGAMEIELRGKPEGPGGQDGRVGSERSETGAGS